MGLDGTKYCRPGWTFNGYNVTEIVNISLYECQRLVDLIPAFLPGRIHLLWTEGETESRKASGT